MLESNRTIAIDIWVSTVVPMPMRVVRFDQAELVGREVEQLAQQPHVPRPRGAHPTLPAAHHAAVHPGERLSQPSRQPAQLVRQLVDRPAPQPPLAPQLQVRPPGGPSFPRHLLTPLLTCLIGPSSGHPRTTTGCVGRLSVPGPIASCTRSCVSTPIGGRPRCAGSGRPLPA